MCILIGIIESIVETTYYVPAMGVAVANVNRLSMCNMVVCPEKFLEVEMVRQLIGVSGEFIDSLWGEMKKAGGCGLQYNNTWVESNHLHSRRLHG